MPFNLRRRCLIRARLAKRSWGGCYRLFGVKSKTNPAPQNAKRPDVLRAESLPAIL